MLLFWHGNMTLPIPRYLSFEGDSNLLFIRTGQVASDKP
jgi:hypothetical protein